MVTTETNETAIAPKPYIKGTIKWCSVSSEEIEKRDYVLTASSYDIEAKYYQYAIEHGKYPATSLDKLAYAYVGSRFRRIWIDKSDAAIPIYQPSVIKDIKPLPDKYIAKKTRTDIEYLRVNKGQILLTCSGSIGKSAYVSKALDDKVFSHDLIRISSFEEHDAGYIYAFLNTEAGKKILLTNTYGAVITHIEPEHLANIIIPNPPEEIKEHIHNLIVTSYELRDESNDIIDAATNLLLNELNLPEKYDDFDDMKGKVNCFVVDSDNLDNRLDASYHVPIVKKITEHIKKYADEVTTVGDLRISRDVVLPGRFKRVYVEEGNGRIFIGGKQIGELDPAGKKYLSATKHEKRIYRELEIHENTILLTRSGTIGRITLTPKHWESWIPSDHIIRVEPRDNQIAGYLYIFLSSPYALPLITHNIYGAVIDEIDDKQVRQIPIPFLKNKEAQAKINSLALLANEKRYEAYLKEQEAIAFMNDNVIFA